MKSYEDNPKSIKYHVKQYLIRHAERFRGKKIVDLPAGNGVTTRIIRDIGGIPIPFDLFPEYFSVEGIHCTRADVTDHIPLADGFADAVICQEGIEHFSDQYQCLKEFNRILKKGGSLILTTPNYSNMRSRLSYFLSESERFNDIMPPNEIDAIWMNRQDVSSKIYFGHVFLIGIQKLRLLASLSGFRIRHIQFTRMKTTSLLLTILFYPFIYLSNYITYRKNLRKDKGVDKAWQASLYREIFRLSVNPSILVDGHLFVEFIKEREPDEVASGLKSVHREFGMT